MISTLLRRPWIRTCGYWLFTIGMGTVLLLIEDADIEPMFSILAFIYWSLLFYWGASWIFNQIKSILKQRKEKISLELMHLKSQVSPHFFFNTLNNLYGLIDKDTAQAKQMILTLSEMMRYSIYDGQKEWVLLEDELKYIRNYIDLHKARYHKVSDIRLNHSIRKPGITVTPLLFIILLENAFKHGLETLREKAFVHVELTADVHEIQFSIINNFDSTCQKGNKEQGIGLQNLARRLELVYPGRHSLTWSTNDDSYSAKLTLQTK
jgi:two-component system sensor histidine kinase AlgZ